MKFVVLQYGFKSLLIYSALLLLLDAMLVAWRCCAKLIDRDGLREGAARSFQRVLLCCFNLRLLNVLAAALQENAALLKRLAATT